jgi:hypothetical protein
MLYCLQRRLAVPQAILDIAEAAYLLRLPMEDISYKLFHITVEVCSIREKECYIKGYDPGLLNTSFEIDKSFEEWVKGLPEKLKFLTVIDQTGISLEGFYHHYPNALSASLMNAYRCARILLNSLMYRQLSQWSSSALAQSWIKDHKSPRDILTQLSSEICASIPFYYIDTQFYPLNAITGQGLIWPLYTVATTSVVTMQTRAWIIAKLRDISQKTASLQGLALANALCKTFEITAWNRKETIEAIDDDRDVEW